MKGRKKEDFYWSTFYNLFTLSYLDVPKFSNLTRINQAISLTISVEFPQVKLTDIRSVKVPGRITSSSSYITKLPQFTSSCHGTLRKIKFMNLTSDYLRFLSTISNKRGLIRPYVHKPNGVSSNAGNLI